MRMARLLFYNAGSPEWRYYHPDNVTMLRQDDKACVLRMKGGYVIDIDMSTEDALDELNAALSYDRYQEAALQGAKLRKDFLGDKKKNEGLEGFHRDGSGSSIHLSRAESGLRSIRGNSKNR